MRYEIIKPKSKFWFAWYPVFAENHIVWLEYVERELNIYDEWEYKLLTKWL